MCVRINKQWISVQDIVCSFLSLIFNQNIICLPLQQASFQLMSQISLALLLKSSIFSPFFITKIKSYSVFFINKLGSEPCFTLTLGSSVVEGTRFSVLTELLCSLQNCRVQMSRWSPAIGVSDPPKHLPPPTKPTPSFLQLLEKTWQSADGLVS